MRAARAVQDRYGGLEAPDQVCAVHDAHDTQTGRRVATRPLDVILWAYQMPGMTRPMDEQAPRQAPRTLTDGLDASVRDLAAGRVGDAAAAQREAKRLLEAFEKAQAGGEGGTRAQPE